MMQCYVCEMPMYARTVREYANARFISYAKYDQALRGIICQGVPNDDWALSLLGDSGNDFPTSEFGSSDVQVAFDAIIASC